MHANEASRVLARGARLSPPRRRVRDVLERQALGVEDLFAVKVRHRHLGGGDEPQVAVLDLEQLVSELGQVRGPCHRGAVHEHRRPELDVAMFAGVHVEHELHQRALEPGTIPD